MKIKPVVISRALGLTACLFVALCASLAILGRSTASFKEGMMFGVDATSDDLLNYTDSPDADIRNDIKWKIRKCSTITQQDLDNAVADARRVQQINDSRNFTAPIKVCHTGRQALLGNKTCNEWSWKDESTDQRRDMPNYKTTGTVPPGWDCWYEPTSQCVSRDCLNSSDPTKGCGKRFW